MIDLYERLCRADVAVGTVSDSGGRARTSIAWEHFEIKDRLRSIATCNHCHENFSYRTTAGNLTKHLRVKHGFVKEDEINENADAADDKIDPKKALKGELWQHYEIKDEFLKLATCNLCHEPFSYQSCSVLVKHLQKQHDIECLVSSDEEQSDEDSNEEEHDASQNGTRDEERRRKSSKAWEFFEIKDPRKKIAACTVCGAKCSYRASVSNLTKHVRTQHGSEPFRSSSVDKSDGEQEASDVEENKDAKKALKGELWQHYEIKDEFFKLATCNLCNEPFSYQTCSGLVKHLQKKHDIECLVSSDEEQSDEDTDEEERDASQNGTNDNEDRRRNRPSKAWEFFEIKDSRKKIAACTVCGATCSYRASVSNLTKHVRTQHGSGPFRSSSVEKSDGEQEASDVEQN
ncbi:zinc finger protein 79-like, partial [Hyposmocoma kahamanoa]|uniref:zinc finger protein 79-like n=1 Tax=Hyposmocoma kahamanoa TaxID=1477025 RepID=UPI000E6D8F98